MNKIMLWVFIMDMLWVFKTNLNHISLITWRSV